jgi:hypothetical protein
MQDVEAHRLGLNELAFDWGYEAFRAKQNFEAMPMDAGWAGP